MSFADGALDSPVKVASATLSGPPAAATTAAAAAASTAATAAGVAAAAALQHEHLLATLSVTFARAPPPPRGPPPASAASTASPDAARVVLQTVHEGPACWSLQDVLAAGLLSKPEQDAPFEACLQLLSGVAAGMHYAHAAGVSHGALAAECVMIAVRCIAGAKHLESPSHADAKRDQWLRVLQRRPAHEISKCARCCGDAQATASVRSVQGRAFSSSRGLAIYLRLLEAASQPACTLVSASIYA